MLMGRREIDGLGRIALPLDLRVAYGWESGKMIDIFSEEGTVFLKAYEETCWVCGRTSGFVDYSCVRVCKTCIDKLNRRGR